jgi:hypothetical protein
LIARIAMALASIGLVQYQTGGEVMVTLDGQRLISKPRPSPFHLRWLLPTLFGPRAWCWVIMSWSSLVLATVYFPGDLWVAALFVSLPWFKTMAAAPILVDAPALAVTLASRAAQPSTAIGLSVLGAAISERAPVWMGLYTLRPEVLCVGLMAVLAAWKWIEPAQRDEPSALRVGLMRARRWSDARMMLAPWGAGLAALFCLDWSLQDLAIVAVAYGQTLVAWDTTRMVQWAAPVVLPKAVSVLPPSWLLPAVVVTWFNPWCQAKPGEVVC